MLKVIDNKTICAIALVVLFCIFSSSYLFSVAAPQMGWWQYYAWRMSEGDILYKDIYLFMPPYFVFLTKLLWGWFDNHFILYTLCVGLPIKIACLLIVYNIINKFTKPFYSALATLTGACVSALYLTDLWYDYNPVSSLPCLICALCVVKCYLDIKNNHLNKWTPFWTGLSLAVCFGFKQTFGLAFIATYLVMELVLYFKEYKVKDGCSVKAYLFSRVTLPIGVLIGMLPMFVYLTANDCWSDYFRCMSVAGDSKGDILSIISRPFYQLKEFKIWVYLAIALVTWRLVKLIPIKWSLDLGKAENFICIGALICIGGYFIILILCPDWYHSVCAHNDWMLKMRPRFSKVLIYSGVLAWVIQAVKYFIGRKANVPVLIFTSFCLAHFFAGAMSTPFLEEIFFTLYIPFSLAIAFKAEGKLASVKNFAIGVLCLLVMGTCISTKRTCPYSWQGWKSDAITENNVHSTIPGLEGLVLPEITENSYKEIINLINENCGEGDKVFQFSNIPLFNILTKKEIPSYTPITWLDVCPDKLARECAVYLRQNQPKMIIWHDMRNSEWYFVEQVFRNGTGCGQRAIINFHDSIMKRNYHLLKCIYNNRDGNIELWIKNDIIRTTI